DEVSLRQVADPGADLRRERGALAAEDPGPPAGGMEESQEHADGGGLPGAVPADEGAHRAAGNGQVDPLHRRPFAEVPGESLGGDDFVTHGAPPPAAGPARRASARAPPGSPRG